MVLEYQQKQEQDKEYTLCLNMIVKNESHIIKDTLTKLLKKIKFDYWVISDTGSTDETCEIITEFFKEVGIPGELYEDDWVDFAHNRNKALEYAFGKSKYLLVFDADDEICGTLTLSELTKDSYSLQFGSYTRPQIVNNYKRWKYVGVLHEYICSNDSKINDASTEIIKGPYHVVSGRSGNRNLDSNKYLKDAIILEKAYYDALDAKDNIYIRYGYYCANSYYDCDKYESAISWYKKTLENGGWAQEKYMSCLKLYTCYEKLNNKEAGFFYLVKSAEYDRERAECYYELIKYYSGSGLYNVAYGYYGVLRDFYENSYLKDGLNNKLFLDESISEFYLPYYVIIVCEKMRDYDRGIHMYRVIFTKKCKIFDAWFVSNILYNLHFFTEHVKEEDKPVFYSLFQEYVDFLVDNNYPLSDGNHEFMKTYDKYGIKKIKASIDECLTSKKILIYTGFMDYLWNDTYVSNNAIGGAEKAVAYLAKNFPREYEIIISGDVADEVVGNVTYVNRFKLQALLDVETFHTIIVSRYVSFFILFPRFNCHQLYLSAHDSTGFLNNFNDVPVNSIIEENNKYINGVICLTAWHKLNTIQSHPCLKDKVSVINNGILVPVVASSDGVISLSHNKIKNKFVWTSCSYRGLDVMLKLWDKILEFMPDATLDISSYDAFPNTNSKKDGEIQTIINNYGDSVKHHGKLNTLQLHNLVSKAEFWLYTNTFYETSCITALEMLVHEVVCLYYPLAGLNDTIGKYGIQVIPGTEIQSIMNLSEERKVEIRINGKKYAMSCSWENRAKEWESVLGLNELNNQRIYDLHNNYTIPRNHINYLNKLKYNFQPKIIYDIGANVLNWTKEAKKVWNGADIIVFDAIKSAEFLYKEHHYKYHIGVLSDTDDKIVKFYENSEHPAGNSYYKEVGHEKSNELYPENKFTEQFSTTLATVVKNNNFPLPDLIKFDVQGCELDIIKGSIDIINHAKYLIVELQIIEYNKGAPLANETIKFLEDNNWELLTKTPFCDNGPDGDYCFKNNRIVNKISNMKMLGLNPTYPIYIVNLKRRKDRRDNMEKQLKLSGIDSYNFVEAVDGKALNASSELFSLFERNDFNCNKGVVGCALSHIHLWNKLINDKENDFYVVLEDDITFCDNFKKYLGDVCKLFVEKKLEHLALGEYNTSKVFPTDNFKIDVYSKDLYKEYHTTFAYIISKNAAKKNINYINSCSIKCASDNPQAFGYTLNYSALNVNLVHCQIINEYGTDIQSNNIDDFFEFTTSNDKKLKILTVSFCDWWEKEYSGGCFDLNNNFFTNLLREYGNNYEIKIINPFENPDILFYSIFGVSHKNYTAGRKIFFSGEPYPQRDDADFNLTFDENSFDNTRVPLWLCYFDKLLIEECKKRRNNQNMIPNREKFCSFIAGGPGLTNNRKEFVEKLSKYKQVDCGGSYLNNIGYNVPLGFNCSGKIEHNNSYKFAMAFESAMYKGYVTEKICDVFKSNCVPIYWGHPDVVKDYNPKTFINANDFENFDELVDYIIKVDNDEELYKSFFEEQIITPQWFDILLNDQNKTFFKNLADKIIGKTQNIFNSLHELSSKNEEQYNYNFVMGFYDNGLSERGTTTMMFSYADYAEKYFKCKSIIFYNKHHHANNNQVINRFSNRFDVYRVENFNEIDRIISDKNIKYFYNTCGGKRNCTELVKNCKNLIHAVFDIEPFGDKYSAISDYIVKKSKYPDIDAIPYMIDLPIHNDNMRHELNLPDNAFVIGRIGGYEQFDIKEAHTGIINFLNNANNTTYFVFVNTAKFYEHPQIIYLDKIVDPYLKVKYINTCNCMIHARSDGETFGLAIAEFSSFNKPIVTCRSDKDNCHLDILGEKAIIFDSETSLINILKDIKNIVNSRDDWNAYKEYTPDKVMNKFLNVFMPEINNSSDNITFDNINYIDMKSKAPHFHNTKELVIVSAFLDINREKWSTAYKRTTRDYILSFSNYFNYNTKMLVFIDDKYIEELKEIYNNSLHNNTIFIPINNDWMTKHIHAWQLLDNSNDIMQSDEYINLVKDRIACGNPENIYADYNAINHSKIDFICYAINNNLINRDDFICWSDFGYFNSILHNNPSEYPINHLDITKFNPNKLSFCLRNKLDNKDKDTIHTLVNAPERFTGSFFAGSATLMIKLQELYHISLKELYNNNISDDDQHIYLRCFLKEPNIFDLYLDSCQWPKGLCYFEKLPDRFELVKTLLANIKNGKFVEIGCDRGTFSKYILTVNKTSTLYSVDPYISYDNYIDSINYVTGDNLYNETNMKLTQEFGDRFKLIREFSNKACNLIPDNLNFVYIDGNHQYEYVYEDLCLWWEKLAPNGIIVGDDAVDTDETKRDKNGDIFIEWCPGSYGKYGVIHAFNRFISEKKCYGQIIGNQFVLFK